MDLKIGGSNVGKIMYGGQEFGGDDKLESGTILYVSGSNTKGYGNPHSDSGSALIGSSGSKARILLPSVGDRWEKIDKLCFRKHVAEVENVTYNVDDLYEQKIIWDNQLAAQRVESVDKTKDVLLLLAYGSYNVSNVEIYVP